MFARYNFASLTRIAPLAEIPFEIELQPRSSWGAGDYVVCEVSGPRGGYSTIELPTGRMMDVAQGDLIVGALGTRHATLEATGTWEKVDEEGHMHLLTSAGLFGKLTSKSPYSMEFLRLQYRGHVCLDGEKATMRRFVEGVPERTFETPTVLLVGTSMSAGKTTAARIIIRQLKQAGLRVLGAKLAGAGRYRDIQTMSDVGADHVFDFVDVGLPSTVHPPEAYRSILRELLSRMAGVEADVAVIELGASPLEPYNGDIAIEEIRSHIRCTVLCASDPYAVYGVMKAYELRPTIVSGVATNTRAGIELSEKLSGVPALNLLDSESLPRLRQMLEHNLELSLMERIA